MAPKNGLEIGDGAVLAAAMRRAVPIANDFADVVKVRRASGATNDDVVAAAIMVAIRYARAMDEEAFVRYARQQFAIIRGAESGTLDAVMERITKENGGE